ncbi:hypothetical protein GCM10010435_76850 [Winogradskya consettensis]|uniref:Glycosyltransferase 2-like domain-containing protein n=1 Tax=Winogradskya consettensis TaxID=113560 RepID=A0A919SPQ4_9ACTN|nr:glycosyltransferase family 2 protein [Actinoplanes consettensis]GIM74583.1 hypothetical protein Aco04nite_41060 [Actinoplanes consettensis]
MGVKSGERQVAPKRRKPSPGTRSGPTSKPELNLSRAQRNIVTRQAYLDCSETAGPPISPERADQPVIFRHIASPMARVVMTLFVLANIATAGLFLGWLLLPEHVPGAMGVGAGGWQLAVARASYCVMIVVELIRLGQSVTVCLFAFNAKDPVPMDPPIGLRVALLTTIVPSKEPIEVAERTLRRMRQVLYAGQVDVWILDEGDDPQVKAMAARIGVKHFSRKGRPEYNTEAGQFRAKTKSGNHNSWRAEHEHDYDVVANVDPDHVPMINFLERTLGYFRDPDVAFVVSPQVYGNMYQNWVSHGASVQQYLFNGIIARGGNGLDAPLLTGTGHLYRPSAMRDIGGYQDSIIEDHVTSIKIHTATNPGTGNRWKGVYTPDVIAIGEGPTSWADYFNQQKRWAYGVWEIILHRRLHNSNKLGVRRRWGYRLLQFYYPSVAVSLMLGNIATATYLATGVSAVDLDGTTWGLLWGATLVTWFGMLLWLRRYNIATHEREEIGMPGMGLALFCGPIYVAAGLAALFRRKLAFVVTAKGKMRTTESFGTFRLHLLWFLFAAGMLALSYTGHHDYTLLRIWAGLTLLMGLAPPLAAWISGISARRHPEPPPQPLAELLPLPEPSVEAPGPGNVDTAVIPVVAPHPAALPAAALHSPALDAAALDSPALNSAALNSATLPAVPVIPAQRNAPGRRPGPVGPGPAGPAHVGPAPAGPGPVGPGPAGPAHVGPAPAGPGPAGPGPAVPAPAAVPGQHPVPPQRPGAVPSQRPGPVPAQRPAPVPAQRPGPVPAQRPGPVPAQRPGPVPAQRPASPPVTPTAPPQRPPIPARHHIRPPVPVMPAHDENDPPAGWPPPNRHGGPAHRDGGAHRDGRGVGPARRDGQPGPAYRDGRPDPAYRDSRPDPAYRDDQPDPAYRDGQAGPAHRRDQREGQR